jgi:Tfp pilus assembly protein PilX
MVRSRTHIQSIRSRGMAMMLVIISLSVATVLTTAYVASRDNSAMIGANASGASSARGAALSGLQMAETILQTNANWRTIDATGVLMNSYPVGAGTVTVSLTDTVTGLPPTASTQYVDINSVATVGTLLESASAKAYVPLTTSPTADVSLSEFAVFASDQLSMYNQSSIARWPTSPLSKIADRIRVGTRSLSGGTVRLSDSAVAIDTSVYHGPGAASSLINITSGATLGNVALADAIPMPAAPTVTDPAIVITLPLPADLTMNGGTATVATNVRYQNVVLKNNAVRTIQGNFKTIAQGDYKINSGAKLVINGSVTMIVFGRLELDSGSIELKPGARLSIYVRGAISGSPALSLRDSYIGDLRADSTRDNTGQATWMDASRVSIYSMPPALTANTWAIDRNSVIKGSIYAPDVSSVSFADQSALYGRIATKVVELRNDAAIFYDSALNSRNGYTSTTSALFDSSGRLKPLYATVTSLDSSVLQPIADAYGSLVRIGSSSSSTVTPATLQPTSVSAGPTDPTPRPVHIDFELVSVSSDVRTWESAH